MKRYTKDIFITKSKEIHGDKYDYSLVKYKNNKTKVIILCIKHNILFEQRPNDHLNGQGCTECKKDTLSKLKKFTTTDFLNKSKEIHGDLYDYSLSVYNGNDVKVKILCEKHGEFEQRPHNHLIGHGCPICKIHKLADINRLTKFEFIEKSKEKHGNKYDYSLVYYVGSKLKIKIICPIHGVFKQAPNGHLLGYGCPKCNSSKGELKILNYLNDNYISFIFQKTFEGCINKQKLYFDFYLPDYNICIEFDGKQHYESINFFGGEDGLKKTQIRDEIKNNFCKNNDITIIRITYKDFKNIELILNNKLKIKNYE